MIILAAGWETMCSLGEPTGLKPRREGFLFRCFWEDQEGPCQAEDMRRVRWQQRQVP